MRALPFPDGVFADVTHLWCLYHVDDPVVAIGEARRVLRSGGCYYASTAGRDNDPEVMWEGYPPSSFDAEEAAAIVARVFDDVEQERWDGKFFPLATREEVRAYCRHHYIPAERGEQAELPLWLTKGAYSCVPPSPDPGVDGRSQRPPWHRTHTSAMPVVMRRSGTLANRAISADLASRRSNRGSAGSARSTRAIRASQRVPPTRRSATSAPCELQQRDDILAVSKRRRPRLDPSRRQATNTNGASTSASALIVAMARGS
jgi:hypothetical protein